MAVVLIPAAWVSVTWLLRVRFAEWGWRLAALRATVLLGAYCVLSTELLSIIRGVNRSPLIIVWLVPLVACGFLVRRLRNHSLAPRVSNPDYMPRSWPMRIMLLALSVVLAATALVAWLSPPNTWDSLNTHMSRVAHWAQEGGVVPYATGIEKQNYYPPFPGMAILQVYVLAQGDRWANFIQWSAMLVSLIGVSYIAKQLGASPLGQASAAVFAASLPMGIAQATSTMTDYLVALWLVIVAVECLRMRKDQGWIGSVIFQSTAAALAIGTKPIAFAYLLPFALYSAYLFLRKLGPSRAMLAALCCLSIVMLINAGYIGRNLWLYGHPFGPRSGVEIHANEILDWRVLISNTLRNASLHAWSPSSKFNAVVYVGLRTLHQWMNLDLADSRTSMHGMFSVQRPSTDEKKAGNFYHAVLSLTAMGLLVFAKRKGLAQPRILAGLVILSFPILGLAFKFSIFGARYHTAFFVLLAPVVARVMEEYLKEHAQVLLGLGLLISSWPWLVSLDQRSLWPTEPDAVDLLSNTRQELLFPELPGLEKDYAAIVEKIQDRGCKKVGIAIKGSGAEYPFWAMLGAPRSNTELEWIIGDAAPSAAFRKPDFEPCALICDTSCPDEWTTFRGMPIALDRGGFRLFMRTP